MENVLLRTDRYPDSRKGCFKWIVPALLLTVSGLPAVPMWADVQPIVGQVQQTSKFKGKISDSGGDPLPGATVQLKGSTKGSLRMSMGISNLTIARPIACWWFPTSVWRQRRFRTRVKNS